MPPYDVLAHGGAQIDFVANVLSRYAEQLFRLQISL
jgi:hypothetical protein